MTYTCRHVATNLTSRKTFNFRKNSPTGKKRREEKRREEKRREEKRREEKRREEKRREGEKEKKERKRRKGKKRLVMQSLQPLLAAVGEVSRES